MTHLPTVSVVIPSYRRRDAVLRALQSVFAQTHRPTEIIVVDDGSADGTVEMLRSLPSPLPLVILAHDRNKGGSAARNTGIAAAHGEWIAFLDSDDVWRPEKLERQLDALMRAGPTYGVAYCGIRRVDDDGRTIGVARPTASGDLFDALLGRNVVGSTSTVIVRRDLLEQVGGFDESLRSCQDWELWLRLAKVSRFAVVSDPLVDYTDAEAGRITTNPRSRISGHMAVYRKHLREPLRTHRAARAEFFFVLGEMMLGSGRADWAARLLEASLRLEPRNARRAVYLLLAKLRLSPGVYRRVTFALARILRIARDVRAGWKKEEAAISRP